MDKTQNNKAWFLVLPVLVIVAFSAVIPLMTVVNYSVNDTFGENEFFWNGLGWFEDMIASDRMHSALGRQVTCVGDGARPIRRVAWCTGGAQGYFEAAMAAGADAFITGEISEPQAHLAREMGVAFLACGHHASERYGAPAVGARVAQDLGLVHRFIDIDNPA